MENNENVSISIVTYNNANVLTDRLKILLPIFEKNNVLKVYIIDNCSSDDTAILLKERYGSYENVELILLDENKGFGFGHNQAIKITKAKYHIVMNLDSTPNSDDLILQMENFMNRRQDVDLLSPLVLYPNKEIQYLTRSEPTVIDLLIRFMGPKWFPRRQKRFIHFVDGYDHEQIIENATGCFMFLRASTLKKVGGFDERYFIYMEDSDLTKEINKIGKAIFSPDFQVIHEWQRANHSTKGSMLMINSMIAYFRKWGWKLW